MSKRSAWVMLILSVTVAAPVGAAETEKAPKDLDGRVLATPCWGCHGPQGNSQGAIPSVSGLPANLIEAQMQAFKSGERPSTIMNRIAKGYSEAEIKVMAEYIANINKKYALK